MVGGQFGTQALYSAIKSVAPKNLWAGNPIASFLGVKPAYASGPAPAPKTSPYAGSQSFQMSSPVQNTYSTPTNTGGGMPSNPAPQSTQNNQQPYDQINQQQDNGNAQIDADYNQSMGMLDSATSGLQGQAGTATSQINNDISGGKTDLTSAQTTQQQGVQQSLNTGETTAKSSTQQARDLFRQTQQSNNAQLSALGISSSSVAEALAERLGVETARRIAGVSGALGEVRQNATNELGRINKYYTEKTTQLEENGRIQREGIQQSLMSGLNQINSARSQAASDKASARANLLSQVQNQIYSLTQQQQQFDQSLKTWAAQKSAALTPIVQDPNYLNTLMSTANTFNKQFAPTGFQFTPEVSYDKNGTMTGKITSNKQPTDQFGNPIQQSQPTGQMTSGVGQPDFGKYPNDGFTY